MEDIDYLWESTKAGLRGFESGRSGTVAIDGKEFNALKRIGELELTSAKTTVSSLIKLSKLKYDEANIEIWLSRLHHAYTADEFEMLAESTEYDEETDDDKTAEDDDYRYEEEDNEVEDDAYYYEDDEVEVVPPESDFSELQGDSHVEEIERENRAKLLQNRARATSIRYEANIKEYRQFCSAPPGSILNGVKLPDSKRIEDDLVTTAKVIFFLQQYFTLRPHLRAPRVGESMKYSSIKSAISALKDLQSEQCLNGTPEQINALKNVPKLCENPTDLDKILRHARTIHRAKKLAAAQDNAESTEEDIALTRDQIQQLAEFGVKIGAPRHPKNWLLSGNRFHLVHTIHRATGERGDTVRKASLNGA